jgi:DNA-binding GntR family transcriptional regulator
MTGIGRTPIREAILRLARKHLIVILPQRGLLVPGIDVNKKKKKTQVAAHVSGGGAPRVPQCGEERDA